MRALDIIGVAVVASTIVSGCFLDRSGEGTAEPLSGSSATGLSGGAMSGGTGGGSNTGGAANTGGSGGAGGEGGTAGPETTVMVAKSEGNDSWNLAANWDHGVPSGEINAEISAGIAAEVHENAPTYTGTLTLHNGASLTVHRNDGFTPQAALESASTIIMSAGSWFHLHTQGANALPAITLAGMNTEIRGEDDWHITAIDGTISGAYPLTFVGWNGHDFQLKTSNSFSGNMICNAMDRYIVTADVAGAFGTGDVIVNRRAQDDRSAVLVLNANDAIADTAMVYLNGSGWDGSSGGDYAGTYTRLQMNADDTVAAVFIDGVQLNPGTYTGTQNPNDWIGGSGTLTVGP